ncbi:acyltransferase [Pseudochrobactrum kiredjianiae]|uniref:Acyltransferase n=1 Tax=Pseudochrobactrum kiredjianiae TaxID=386305 RepID=A0ABW3V0Q3_9HYPH|nr:acyltransferase [Pseudochrobactrum kiredjianiae]MDM7853283.1 acyltransferase [Pseudochrobactrum kiredjianiae]
MKAAVSYFNSIFWQLLPSTRFFFLKRKLLTLAGARIGANVRCASSVRTFVGGSLSIGANTWVGHEVLFVGGEASITIGADCDIAPRVSFITGTHEVEASGPKAAGRSYSLPITIGSGCWICAGATLLGGTVIGDHSIIAAGAVVRGEFAPYSIIGGVPAKVIRNLLGASPAELTLD